MIKNLFSIKKLTIGDFSSDVIHPSLDAPLMYPDFYNYTYVHFLPGGYLKSINLTFAELVATLILELTQVIYLFHTSHGYGS